MANRFAKYATPASGGVIVQNPDAATERARKAEEDKRAAIAAADAHAGAVRAAADHDAKFNADGTPKVNLPPMIGDETKHGAEYLATLPPNMRNRVQQLLDGRSMLTAREKGQPFGQQLMDAANQADPTFDEAASKARYAARLQFTGQGKGSQIVQAADRFAAHVNDLYNLSNKMPGPNLGMATLSNVATRIGQEFDQGDVAAYNQILPMISGEVQKLTKNGSATVDEGEKIMNGLRAGQPREVRNRAIAELVSLGRAQIQPQRDAWESAWAGSVAPPMPMDFSPATQAIFDAIENKQPGLTRKQDHSGRDHWFTADGKPVDPGNGAGGGGGGPPPNAMTENRIIPGGGPGAAGFGATTGSTPIPQAMQDEYASRLPSVLTNGRFDPDAFAALRVELDKKYGFPTSGAPRYREWAEQTNKALAHGGVALSNTIPAPERELSGWEQFRNNAVDNPVGAFVAGAGNAGGFGIPTLLAGDQMGALRDAHPLSSDLGELVGGVTGAFMTGGALGAVAGKVANPTVASLLAKPLAADVAYGTISGATQADNPLEGAAGGLLAGVAGNYGGRALGRWLPRVTGIKAPEDSLLPGERRVLSAVDRTGRNDVAAALAQGQELGVPVSLADVSNDVNSLTGAALRRSPKAAGDARVTLADRGRGQYDRFTGAIERDLGPIENIPQRSEDLITQAKAKAGPLYDQAYKNDGAGVFYNDVKDLVQRPSMQSALGKARQIAAEEGRDPNALGLVLDKDGVLVKVDKPTWQTWDYVKRGMDDVLEGYRDKTSGKLVLDTQGRAINDTLHDFLGKIDVANPDYAAARTAYATPAAERDALARGQAAVTTSPDQLSVNMGKASPSQADQMRLGFQSSLAEKAGNYRYSTNPFDSVLGTPAMERRLATMYPDQPNEVARLLSQRDLERQVAGSTNSLIGNSATAERQVADDAFAQDSLLGTIAQGAVETAITGAPVVTAARSGLGRGLGSAYRDWRAFGLGQKGGALADDISRLALNMDPAAASSILDDMAARDASHQAIVQELLKMATNRGGHIGAGASSAVAAGLMH